MNTYEVTEKVEGDKILRITNSKCTSPDGKWLAYTKDYNLYVKSTSSNKEYKLTNDGQKGYEYATWYGWDDIIEGENGERPPHFYVKWSEDSKWISSSVVDFRNAEKDVFAGCQHRFIVQTKAAILL